MKPKNFTLLIFGVVVLGMVAWYLIRPGGAVIGTPNQMAVLTKATSIVPVASSNQVEFPTASAALPKSETRKPTPETADPHVKPDTTIAEALRLLEGGDVAGFVDQFVGPMGMGGFGGTHTTKEQMVQLLQNDPYFVKRLQEFQANLRSIHDNGIAPMVEGDGNGEYATYEPSLISLRRQNGLWYVFNM